MNKLCFDINTSVSVSNGIDLKQLGAVMQNFTSKYLYVTNNQLYGVDELTELEPCHRLIRFDGCFQLIGKDMRTMLYCFRKELADHLDCTNKFTGYTFGADSPQPKRSPLKSIPRMDGDVVRKILEQVRTKFSNEGGDSRDEIGNEIGNMLGDTERRDPREEYEINLAKLIARKDVAQQEPTLHELTDPSEIEMANRFGRSELPTEKLKTFENAALKLNKSLVGMGERFVSNFTGKPGVEVKKSTQYPNIDLAVLFAKDASPKPSPKPSPKLPPAKPPRRKTRTLGSFLTPETPPKSDITDTMAQARRNETAALISAIRKNLQTKRSLKSRTVAPDVAPKVKRPKYNPTLSKGKDEDGYDTGSEDVDTGVITSPVVPLPEPKVCALVADLLRKKAANRQMKAQEETNQPSMIPVSIIGTTEEKDSSSMDIDDDTDTMLPVFPIVPRMFRDNVKLSSLPKLLQCSVVDAVMGMKEKDLPVGTFYFNGGTFAVLFDNNNLASLYDWDNTLNTDRLRPTRFDGEYDGTPGSLPIAQFTVHKSTYNLYLEPKIAGSEGKYKGQLTMDTIAKLENFGPEAIKRSVMASLEEYQESVTIGYCGVEVDIDDAVSVSLTVLKCRDCDVEIPTFWPCHINDEYTLLFQLKHIMGISNSERESFESDIMGSNSTDGETDYSEVTSTEEDEKDPTPEICLDDSDNEENSENPDDPENPDNEENPDDPENPDNEE